MTEQSSFVIGGVTFPLATSTGNSALKDADPALYYTIDYFASVLQTYLGARLVAEASALGLSTGPNAITQAVGYSLPYDPVTVLQEQQISHWPLLAVFREKSKFKWKSMAYQSTQGTWKVLYVLPPLSGGQREKLGPILSAVPKILMDRIENMFDPGYQSGLEIWKAAGLEEITLTDDAMGSFEIPQSSIVFPAWSATLYVAERSGKLPSTATGGKYLGTDVEIDTAGSAAPLDTVDVQANSNTPTSIATLEVYYRADKGITLDTSKALVANWADQSGHGYSAAPNAPVNRPVVAQDPQTGMTVARFDGAQAYLTATDAAFGANTGKTLVVAFRLWDAALRSSLAMVTDATANGTLSLEANTASSAGGLLGIYAAGSSFDTQFSTDTQWHIAVIRITNSTPGGGIAATMSVQVDDLPAVLTLKSGTGNWQTLASATTFALGGLSSNLAATAAHADIGVALGFSSRLTDTDTASAVAFCKQWLAGTV